jgi:hypothetical protein
VPDVDTLLSAWLSDWVASLPPGTATLAAVPMTTVRGTGFRVAPTRADAAALRIGVGDDPDQAVIQVGLWATWDQLPLSAESVTTICFSVACGGFLEETWTLGSLTLARRASLIVGGDRTLRCGTQRPFLLIPGARWVRRKPEPW